MVKINIDDAEKLASIQDDLFKEGRKRGYFNDRMPSFDEPLTDLGTRVHGLILKNFPNATHRDITLNVTFINDVTKLVIDDWIKRQGMGDQSIIPLLQARGYRIPKTQHALEKLAVSFFDKLAAEVRFCLNWIAVLMAAGSIEAINVSEKIAIMIPKTMR